MGVSVVPVKNRSDRDVEFMCDGQVYIVPAGETVHLVEAVAKHGMRKSVVTLDPETGAVVKALVLATSEAADEEIAGRVPGSELIDRGKDSKFKKIQFANAELPKGRVMSPLEDEE